MSIDRQKVIDTAQKFAAKGQFDKAIVEYMRLVKEDPSDVRILLKIGDLQVRKGAKDDAIATYSRVASGYDQQGFFLKAIAVYKQILSIDPNLTELYSKLADLYVKLGLIPDALAHLDALASRYARGEQYDKLAGVFRQMVQVDPTNLPGHIKLAELLSKLGKSDEAAQEFEAGCQLLREAGRHDDWSKVAERLLFHRPNDANVAKDLARHYIDRQDAKRALPKLQVCFKANPKDVDTLEMLAAAFRELGQLPKTISVLKEIARIHHENGQTEKRLDTLRRVLELAPNDQEAKDGLRGASRMARRPSVPPPGAGAPPQGEGAARKPSSPAMPPANAQAQGGPRRPSRPGLPAAPPAQDDAEEIVVVDEGEEDAVYELEPSAARNVPASAPPAAARAPVGAGPVPPKPPPRPAVPMPSANTAPIAAPPPPRMPALTPSGGVAPNTTRPGLVAPPPQPIAARGAAPPPRAVVPPPQPLAPASMPAPDPMAEIGRIIGEADIFLKYGLKQKAVSHLLRALDVDPASLDVHARLRDLYLDQGDAAAAVRHLIAVAQLVAESDPPAAINELTRALELDPSNAEALELFRHLGGEVDGPGPAQFDDQTEYVPQVPDDEGDGYVGAGATGYDEGPDAHLGGAPAYDTSYEAPRTEALPELPGAQGGGSARDIEEGLDEAEFFVTQGLYDEAMESLQGLLAAHPNHPLVLERIEELEAMLQAQAGGGGTEEDQAFALAEKLAEEVENVEQAGGAQFNAGGEMIDVDTVFAQFKKGIERTVAADDADTHYDLGIAYKEMGLVDDAIGEFTIAAQSPRKVCLAETMIGLCYMEQRGDAPAAIEHFKRALQAPSKTEREEIALYFELGNAYEAVGDLGEAIYYFQKVEKRDSHFRGVAQRVARLSVHVGSGARQTQNADMDEVDRAFDELIKG